MSSQHLSVRINEDVGSLFIELSKLILTLLIDDQYLSFTTSSCFYLLCFKVLVACLDNSRCSMFSQQFGFCHSALLFNDVNSSLGLYLNTFLCIGLI